MNAHRIAVTGNGTFGSATTTAVRTFQTRHALTVDGIVGPRTWEKLIITRRPGHAGRAVAAVQVQLANKWRSIKITSSYDAATYSSVRDFQSKHGLTVDGVVGPTTWRKLLGHFGRPSANYNSFRTAPGSPGARRARSRSSTTAVDW